jgi:CheY-like chemotaxis protein
MAAMQVEKAEKYYLKPLKILSSPHLHSGSLPLSSVVGSSRLRSRGVIMQKILIVDDSELFRKTLRACLHSQFPSLMISEAKDGEEALQMIPAFLPDLIFMDIQMPDRNGLEVTRLIKGQYPDIKVVILTSYDLPEYREVAFRYKADHCASKDSFMLLLNLIFSEGSLSSG